MKKKQLFYADELNVRIVISDVLKNIWLAVLAAIIVCIGVFSYSKVFYKNTYTTEATFVVSPRSNGSYIGFYSSISTANEMAEVFKEVFASDVLNRMIKEDLQDSGIPFTVNASVASGTNILIVSVKSDSPSNAHAVMQSVMKDYRRVSGYLFGGVVLDVLKKPQISLAPSNPIDINGMMTKGAFLAVVLMMFLVAVLSVMRPTVKTMACAKRRMEERPLGVLRKERRYQFFFKKKNRGLLIIDAGTSFKYKEAVLQIAHKIRSQMQKDGKKVLLVTSVAENEGKTTFSANMAYALARHGHKVAYLDMDLRKPAGYKIFSNSKQADLLTCLKEGKAPSLEGDDRLLVVTNSRIGAKGDRLLHSEELKKFVDELKEKNDFVVFDSAPFTATADTGMLLQLADCTVLVVRQDWASYDICRAVSEEMQEEGGKYLGYVLNNCQDSDIISMADSRYGAYGYYGKTKTEE